VSTFVIADGALLDAILDLTYPVWNEGLSRTAYGQWNTAQLRTRWGRSRLHRFALLDGNGEILASAKRYRFDVRLDGQAATMCGIGAVFTPPARRGHGHGLTLLEQLLASERREGVTMAALFSEIGDAYYRRLGFEPVSLDEVTVKVTAKPGAPAMLVRAGDERDLPAIAAMHDVRSSPARLALHRDPDFIQFAIAKRRLFSGLSTPGTRGTEFFVAEEGASAVAYVVITQNEGGWTLEEAGDRDPAGARLGAMLQVLAARDPSRPPHLIRAWWPSAFPVPPQVSLVDRTPAGDQFMVRPLADVAVPKLGEEVFYWRCDQF
jgi:predicted N-acetyltransferase YhbS